MALCRVFAIIIRIAGFLEHKLPDRITGVWILRVVDQGVGREENAGAQAVVDLYGNAVENMPEQGGGAERGIMGGV